jgi:hypothetical protein
MAITVPQFKKGNSNSGSSASVTLATTTTGNTLVVVVSAYNAAANLTVSGIGVSTGSISSAAKFGAFAGIAGTYAPIEVWVAPNITGGTTPLLVVNLSGTTSATDFFAYELAGMSSSTVPDGTAAGAANAAATACVTPSITTANAGSIVFGVFSPANVISSGGSGWTGSLVGQTTGSLTEYAIQTAPGTSIATATQNPSGVYASYVFGLSPTGVVVTARPPQIIVVN